MADKELTAEYVKGTYNTFLSSYENEYSFYRWERTPLSRYQFEQSKRTLLKFLNGKHFEKALEIGGGDGAWTPFLAERTTALDFLDISTEMLKRAQERLTAFRNITYIESDFLQNTLEDGAYECLLSFRNFEYFPDKEKAAAEMHRVLRRGGELLLVTKNPLYDWRGDIQAKLLHKGQLKACDLVKLFEKHEFTVEAVYPAVFGKLLRFGFLRAVFDCMHRCMLRIHWKIWPYFGMHISESVLLYARKK